MTYTIRAVGEKTKPWQSKFGDMVTYYVLFDETGSETVQISRKQSSPAPVAGQTLEGSIETTDYGMKFKQAYAGGPSAPRASGGSAKGHLNDPFAMYLSYAKDLAIACITSDNNGEKLFNYKFYEAVLKAVIDGGKSLYDGRPGEGPVNQSSPSNQSVVPVKPPEPPKPQTEPLFDPFEGMDIS